jgi:hypothetical protein
MLKESMGLCDSGRNSRDSRVGGSLGRKERNSQKCECCEGGPGTAAKRGETDQTSKVLPNYRNRHALTGSQTDRSGGTSANLSRSASAELAAYGFMLRPILGGYVHWRDVMTATDRCEMGRLRRASKLVSCAERCRLSSRTSSRWKRRTLDEPSRRPGG